MERDSKYSQKIFDKDENRYRTYMDFAEEYGYKMADSELARQNKSDQANHPKDKPTEKKSKFWNPDPENVVSFKPKKNPHKQHPIDDQFFSFGIRKIFR